MNYKNYLKNQVARRRDPSIRKIRNGEIISHWIGIKPRRSLELSKKERNCIDKI